MLESSVHATRLAGGQFCLGRLLQRTNRERTQDPMTIHDFQERTITTNGVKLQVATAGKPATPALLLLHGLYDRWETWDPVIRSFSTSYHVIAPDLRGHARSSKPQCGYTPLDYAEDMTGLLQQLDVDQVVPIGHSLGAMVGEYLAADHPDLVRKLVLIDPPFDQNDQTRQWLEILLEAKRGYAEETYETVKELNILSGDDAEWRRQTDWLRATADGPFEAMIEMIDTGQSAQLYEVLCRVACPTLILQADPASGGALSDAGAERALEHLQAGAHRKFENTGHSIHLERTDEFVQVVNEFLERLE
jgi:pimeloyl-ACP methyl ester carboxylesterase